MLLLAISLNGQFATNNIHCSCTKGSVEKNEINLKVSHIHGVVHGVKLLCPYSSLIIDVIFGLSVGHGVKTSDRPESRRRPSSKKLKPQPAAAAATGKGSLRHQIASGGTSRRTPLTKPPPPPVPPPMPPSVPSSEPGTTPQPSEPVPPAAPFAPADGVMVPPPPPPVGVPSAPLPPDVPAPPPLPGAPPAPPPPSIGGPVPAPPPPPSLAAHLPPPGNYDNYCLC